MSENSIGPEKIFAELEEVMRLGASGPLKAEAEELLKAQ